MADEASAIACGLWLAISLVTGKTVALISPSGRLLCDRRTEPGRYWLTLCIVAVALGLSGWWIVKLQR